MAPKFESIEVFGLAFLTLILSILLVGGVSTIWGPILAAFLITILFEVLADYGSWRDIAVALAIVGVILVYPGGLFAGLQELRDFLDSRKTTATAARKRRFQASSRAALMGASDRLAATNHGEIALFDTGEDRPALLLIHGNSSCKEAFHRQVSAFGGHYRIVAFDLPGHGVSRNGNPRTDYTLDAYARITAQIVGMLKLDWPAVFGWSLGGYVALEHAARGHPVRALAICGTSPLSLYPDDMPTGYVACPHMELASRRFHSWREKRDYAEATLATRTPGSGLVRRSVWRTDGRAREQLFARMKTVDWPRQAALLRQAKVPFAMINGSEDPFIDHAYCAGFQYGAIWRGAPQTIDGVGHAPFLAAPETFNRLLGEFLEECNSGGHLEKAASGFAPAPEFRTPAG